MCIRDSNNNGSASARLSNFSIPLDSPGDLNFSNWEREIVNSDGTAFISGNSIQSIDCTSAEDLTFSVTPNILTCDSILTTPNTATLTATDIAGNASMCTTAITISDLFAPELECADFSAQLDLNGDVVVEPGWFLDGARSFYVETTNNGSYPTPGSVDYSVRVRTAGVLSFNWDFESSDTTNTGEVFGVILNGSFLPLSDTTSHSNVLELSLIHI